MEGISGMDRSAWSARRLLHAFKLERPGKRWLSIAHAPATACDLAGAEPACSVYRSWCFGNVGDHLKAMFVSSKAIAFVGFNFDCVDARPEAVSSFPSDLIATQLPNPNHSTALAGTIGAKPHQPAIDPLALPDGIRRHIQVYHLETMSTAATSYSIIVNHCTALQQQDCHKG
jgi:hypothetical protein